jgi:hypothetical protein
MRCIIWLIALLVLPLLVGANLGVYEGGEKVDYSVCCLTNEGSKDSGCSSENETILAPSSDNPITNTSFITEVDDTNYPCLWRGSYDVPSGAEEGTWSIYVQLTNTNGTNAGTVLTFDVVNEKWETNENRIFNIILLVALCLFILGVWKGDKMFPMMSGFLLIVLAIYTAQFGFYGYSDDFVRNSMIIIFAGLGGFLLVRTGYDLATQGW